MLQSPSMCSIREKAALGVPLTLGILIFYFGTLHSSFFDAIPIPDTAMDRAIPFIPAFVVPYFSYYFLLLTPLFVIHESRELRDAAFGYGLIVFTSCIAFFFWPTAISTSYTDPLIRGLLAIDRPRNACPSLHASLSLFCALCTRRNLQSALARYGLWIWTLLVIASTLLTKRHAAVDIAAGVIFGWIVYRLIFGPIYQEGTASQVKVENLGIQDRLAGKLGRNIEALGRYDSSKFLREFAIFVSLAAIGSSISIWAIAHLTVAGFAVGVATTMVSLYSLLRLMREGTYRQLLPSCNWNWISMVLLGFFLLMSFSAFRVLHLRHLRSSCDPRDAGEYRVDSLSRHVMWFLHFVGRIGVSLLNLILIPVLALRFGSATQRKLICSEYALLFLVCSVLLRTFSVRSLFLVWILPAVLTGIFAAILSSVQQVPENADQYLATRI